MCHIVQHARLDISNCRTLSIDPTLLLTLRTNGNPTTKGITIQLDYDSLCVYFILSTLSDVATVNTRLMTETEMESWMQVRDY